MIARLIDERYPDYENVIPKNSPNKLSINRSVLLSSLRRIAIYANKTSQLIRLKIVGSSLQISAEDLDFSNEANERLACEYEGNDLVLGFNAKLLIEMLNNIDVEEIEMCFSAPNKATIILPKEKEAHEDLLLLVMPVALS